VILVIKILDFELKNLIRILDKSQYRLRPLPFSRHLP
jgi:hypothetical protein